MNPVQVSGGTQRPNRNSNPERTTTTDRDPSDAQIDANLSAYRSGGGELHRNSLIESLMPLVRRIAGHVHASLPKQVEAEELVSAGVFGLIAAIDSFDPDKNVAFRVYCTLRVRGAIFDELRRRDWMPRRVRSGVRRLREAESRLATSLGRRPTELELSEELDLAPSALLEWQTFASAESVGGDPDVEPSTSVGANELSAPEAAAASHELWERVIGTLTDRERLIVRMHYEEEQPLCDVAARLSLTRSRVSQIHTNLRKRLRRLA